MKTYPSCIIFGNSPFVDTVDVQNLIRNYVTAGINEFGQKWEVEHCFLYDRYLDDLIAKNVHVPHWMEKPGWQFSPRSGKPIIDQPNRKRAASTIVGFAHFTSSIAVNRMVQMGYGPIYLIGIDHNEEDEVFDHWEGYQHQSIRPLLKSAHKTLKRFIEACQKYAPIYQCNPDATGWNLPYKDVKELYGR